MSELTDAQAVDWIVRMLRAREWNSGADYLEAIAAVVVDTGRDLEHPEDCDGCGAWPGAGCTAPEASATCTRCSAEDRLHLVEVHASLVPLCDHCYESLTSAVAECGDHCNLPLDHVGVCRS